MALYQLPALSGQPQQASKLAKYQTHTQSTEMYIEKNLKCKWEVGKVLKLK